MRLAPAPGDTVQLLVSERIARQFERVVLRPHGMSLSAPFVFTEHGSEMPTYIISIAEATCPEEE